MEAYPPELGLLAASWQRQGVRRIALGASGAVCRARLGDLLMAIQHALPDAVIGIRELGREAALAALASGELDAAVLPGDPDPRFGSLTLWEERIALLLAPSSGGISATLDDLSALSLMVSDLPEERAFHDFAVRRLFDEAERRRPPCRARPGGPPGDLPADHAMLVPFAEPAPGRETVVIDDPRATVQVNVHWPRLRS